MLASSASSASSVGSGHAPAERPNRLRVWLRHRALDREIAAGSPVAGDADRELRARQLISTSERRRVAAVLDCIRAAAEERDADPASDLRCNYAEILDARWDLLGLIVMLCSDCPVAPRGVALAKSLLDQRRSPLFCPRADRTVEQAVKEALGALDPTQSATPSRETGVVTR